MLTVILSVYALVVVLAFLFWLLVNIGTIPLAISAFIRDTVESFKKGYRGT